MPKKPQPVITPATIAWSNNTPLSGAYGDIYFHEDQGLAETEHVFINGNDLPTRFKVLPAQGRFILGETGFGTGLNFLAACDLWLNSAPSSAVLDYVSVELHPLSFQDLEKSLSLFPNYRPIAEALMAAYPPTIKGVHRLPLFNGRVHLTLCFDDAVAGLSQFNFKADAWFLDGFTPSKNPAMWSPALFEQLARLSKPNATASTFTVAGIVRQGLTQAGFSFERVQGFGKKLEMMKASYTGAPITEAPSETPWLDTPAAVISPKRVAIVGAGLAGATTAAALAQRGIQVTVFDKAEEVAAGGSGNHQGALYAKLPVQDNPSGAIHTQGLSYSLRVLKQLDPAQSFWQQSGVYQMATSEKEIKRQSALLKESSLADYWLTEVNAKQASAKLEQPTQCDGVFMKEAGWVSPPDFCKALLNHPNIELKLGHKLIDLSTDEHQVTLRLTTGSDAKETGDELDFDALVLCNAADARALKHTEFLPLKAIRGQVSLLNETVSLTSSVCGTGYASPSFRGKFCFGATFDLHNQTKVVDNESHVKNLGYLADTLPQLAKKIPVDNLSGRVSFRCATADYLPVVGQVPNYDAFIVDFAKLRDDKSWRFVDVPSPVYPRLFVNVGHGSKGLITAPLSAELICSQLLGTPAPLDKALTDRLNPARFIVRSLTRAQGANKADNKK